MGGLAAAVLSLCLAGSGPGSLDGFRDRVEQPAQPYTAIPSSDDRLPELVATRQMLFFIPFEIAKRAETPKSGDKSGKKSVSHSVDVRSVQLWVSEDRGQNWRFSANVSISRRGFLFRAKHDGEYWFLIRTVDPSGAVYDHRGSAPELRVLVDTQPPTLHLDAWHGDGGQICLRWAVDETYLKPGSMNILYRTGPRQPWQTVAIERRSDNRGRINPDYGPWIVNWCPNEGAKFAQIRAKVVDMAGNTAISHAHVNLSEPPR